MQVGEYRSTCVLWDCRTEIVTWLQSIADRVFEDYESTVDIYQELVSPIIRSAMKGMHGEYMLYYTVQYSG